MNAPAPCAMRAKIGDGLNDARLVVGEHDRHERDVARDEPLERRWVDAARRVGFDHIDRKPIGAQQGQVVEDGVVLDRRDDDARPAAIAFAHGLGDAQKGEDVRLGAAAREHDLARAHAHLEARRDGAAAHLQPYGGLTSQGMKRIGVDPARWEAS